VDSPWQVNLVGYFNSASF